MSAKRTAQTFILNNWKQQFFHPLHKLFSFLYVSHPLSPHIVSKRACYTWDTQFKVRVARAARLLIACRMCSGAFDVSFSFSPFSSNGRYLDSCLTVRCDFVQDSLLWRHLSKHLAFVILLFVIEQIRLPSLVLLHFRLNGIQEDSVRAGSSALSAIRISESISVFFFFFYPGFIYSFCRESWLSPIRCSFFLSLFHGRCKTLRF